MIKFFRRFRQQLLSENKFSKYLLYAIGEIILVVIGILIALQINNWKEKRKILSQEKQLIFQLLEDAKKDSIFFENRLFKLKNQIQFYDDIFNMCNNRPIVSKLEEPIDEAYLPFLRLAKQSSLINNNPDAYSSLINKELKLSLQKHISEYEFANSSLNYFNTQIKEYLSPVRVKYSTRMPDIREVKSIEQFSFMCNDDEALGIVNLVRQNAKNCILNVDKFLISNLELSNALRDYLKNEK